MADEAEPLNRILPHDAPGDDGTRLFLHSVRRMGMGGLNDAQAANELIGAFGLSFRRPLILMRALMAELARVSARQIVIAPACCMRMTAAEAILLHSVVAANANPHHAHALLCGMCGVNGCLGLLSSAQAVAAAFADLGRPIDAG
jgi:hypothetical protein